MQQTLNFFDTMLSHDHPVYIGILRLAYEAAKIGNDKALVRLYTVVLLAIPITTFISEGRCLALNSVVRQATGSYGCVSTGQIKFAEMSARLCALQVLFQSMS